MTETGSLNLTTTPITMPLDLQSDVFDNISYANTNAITILEAGIYRIDVTLSGRAIPLEGTTSAIALELAVDGVVQNNTMQVLEFTSLESNTFVFSNFMNLNAGYQLSLLISADPDTLLSTALLGQAAGLTVMRVN